MKKYLPMLVMSIFVFGAAFSGTVGAEENPMVKDAASKILKANESANKSFNQSVNQSNQSVNQSVNLTVNQTASKSVVQSVNKSVSQSVNNSISNNNSSPSTVPKTSEQVPASEQKVSEQKFRVGPTVVLRPVNDVISENEDGLVELYIDNPSLNDVTLNVDARISVPSGIHVYGEGFGQTGAAGTVYGTFSLPPGSARTIYLDIKGEKVGTFTVHFSGMYWPGDDKDNYNPISLTHPFEVKEPSANPEEASSSGGNADADSGQATGVQAQGEGSFSAPGFGALIAAIGLLGVYFARRK